MFNQGQWFILHLGFRYKDHIWYISAPGGTCDSTCKNIGMRNVAEEASAVVPEADCTIIRNFFHLAKTPLTQQGTITNYWAFGYFHTDSNSYYCSKYGSDDVGTKAKTSNNDPKRQVICPCSTGK